MTNPSAENGRGGPTPRASLTRPPSMRHLPHAVHPPHATKGEDFLEAVDLQPTAAESRGMAEPPELVHALATGHPDEPGDWREQVTARSIIFGTVLGVIFSIITQKLNLTAGIIPSLGMAATLLGFFTVNAWSALLARCGFLKRPFTPPENTVMQTCISACAGAAFSGGFGSFLIAMDEQSYLNVGVGAPGNRPEDVFNPTLGRTIPYMFCISFVGIFMLVQLRKRFLIDYDLPYPSGTAGGVLINSLHTLGGESAAQAQVGYLGRYGAASFAWSAFKWFFSSDAGPGCSGGFDHFPSFGLKALAWQWNFDFQLTYIGVGMICPYIVNLSMLAGAVLSWGVAWPLIAAKEGDWFPAGLKEKDFRGLYGYKVFLAIAVFLGDGLYNLVKIGWVSAKAMAAARAARAGLPTAAPGAPRPAGEAARAGALARLRAAASARTRLLGSFRLRGGRTSSAVLASGELPESDVAAAMEATVRDEGAPELAARPLRARAAAAAARDPTDAVAAAAVFAATGSAAAAAAAIPAAPQTPRTPRTPSGRRFKKDAASPGRERTDTSETERERRALDEYRDYVFLRDAIPAWLGVAGYVAFGLLGVLVIPRLYPAVTWGMVIAAYAVAPAFCFANAYAAGLTDWDMASMYGKLCIFAFAAWGGKDGGVISGLAICGVVMATTSAASGLMFDFKTGWITLSSARSMFVSQTIGSLLGCFIAPLTFYLFYTAFPVGQEHSEYPAPYATIYRGMAILGTQGFAALPKHCLELFGGCFALSFGVALLKDALPARAARFLPIPTAAGLTFYLGPSYAVMMCTGAAVKWVWERRDAAGADTFLVPAAAGLIIGDGLWSVPSAVLAMAKVRPPVCMAFMSAGDAAKAAAAAAAAAAAGAPAPAPAP